MSRRSLRIFLEDLFSTYTVWKVGLFVALVISVAAITIAAVFTYNHFKSDKELLADIRITNESDKTIEVRVNRKVLDTLEPQGIAALDYYDYDVPKEKGLHAWLTVWGYELVTNPTSGQVENRELVYCTDILVDEANKGGTHNLSIIPRPTPYRSPVTRDAYCPPF